jgi:ESX secretion system protein EccD
VSRAGVTGRASGGPAGALNGRARPNGRHEPELDAPADLLRVTVRCSGRRVDVALSGSAPLGQLVPRLARLCGAPDDDRALARAAGPALEPASSLAEAGVVDGEVLHIVDPATWRAPTVTELVAPPAAWGLRPWTKEATAALLAGVAVAAALAGGWLALRTGAVRGATAAAALVAAAGLLGGALALRRTGIPPARVAMVTTAAVLAALGAWGVAGEPAGAAGVAAAALAVTLTALVAAPVVPVVSPGGALAAGALAAGAAAVTNGWRPSEAGVVATVLGVLLLRVLAPFVGSLLVVATAGLNPADHAAIATVARRFRTAMASASAGLVVVLVAAAAAMLGSGGQAERSLALLAALALVLRAGHCRFVADVLPLALGAAATLIAVELALVRPLLAGGGDSAGAMALLAGSGLLLACAAAMWVTLPAVPRPPRAAWLVVDLLLVPLALGALGAYAAIARLVQHLGH